MAPTTEGDSHGQVCIKSATCGAGARPTARDSVADDGRSADPDGLFAPLPPESNMDRNTLARPQALSSSGASGDPVAPPERNTRAQPIALSSSVAASDSAPHPRARPHALSISDGAGDPVLRGATTTRARPLALSISGAAGDLAAPDPRLAPEATPLLAVAPAASVARSEGDAGRARATVRVSAGVDGRAARLHTSEPRSPITAWLHAPEVHHDGTAPMSGPTLAAAVDTATGVPDPRRSIPQIEGSVPGVPTADFHGGPTTKLDSPANTGSPKVQVPEIADHKYRQLATQGADRGEHIVVTRDRVDGRGLDTLVSGDALGQTDIAGGPVNGGQTTVAKGMEVECLIEPGTGLPPVEQVAQRPEGDPLLATRHEQRGVGRHALALGPLPADELVELVPGGVGQEDLLRRGLVGRALEHAQGDAAADPAVVVHDVADIERGDLVLAQGRAERERQDDVVAEPVPVLAADLEDAGLFEIGEGAGWAADAGSVRGHEEPPSNTHAFPEDEGKPGRPGSSTTQGPLLVGKRNEQDLLDWLGTEVGFLSAIGRYNEEPLVFEKYQLAFLESKSRYRWVEKARQVGYSFLFACEAVARCHLRDAHTAVMVSYNLEDAKEKVNYARQLAEELPLAYRKKLVIDSRTELGFLSNGTSKRVSRIISNPSKAPRGKKGEVYLDELAHYVNDREVYKGSTALILRSRGQLTGCSSPLGRRGVFWQVAKEELRKYRAYWRQQVPWWLCSFLCIDVVRAAKDAPLMTTEDRVRTFGTKDINDQFDALALDDFQQEFENAYCDESYSFYSYELILCARRTTS